ncbi:hypothetical protein G3N95_23705 [Paraburkholderia sp. Tr-20389]|uniref:hypothetical protein n=1 Tax=Paraburkholderia sp. Tr-20389 TaxID=2703903 RepID=UPI001981E1B7|nr:hypothetical protein [Paraburkholderia sp. Tr-20389]MBN3755970.1 hypothetical protein [Paraburkholderia sp. Tr-20389]
MLVLVFWFWFFGFGFLVLVFWFWFFGFGFLVLVFWFWFFGFGFGFGFGFALVLLLLLLLLLPSLASALCLWFAGVAPVRGGTYFSLQRQRKVGKRKPLTPLAFVLACGPPTGPALHTATHRFAPVASASNRRITHSNHPQAARGSDPSAPPRWQTVCSLSRRMRWRYYDTEPAFQSGVVHFHRDSLHTVCHLGGSRILVTRAMTWECEAGEACT